MSWRSGSGGRRRRYFYYQADDNDASFISPQDDFRFFAWLLTFKRFSPPIGVRDLRGLESKYENLLLSGEEGTEKSWICTLAWNEACMFLIGRSRPRAVLQVQTPCRCSCRQCSSAASFTVSLGKRAMASLDRSSSQKERGIRLYSALME